MEPNDRPIRVTIVQPALAKYRIPVFRELAQRPGIDLQVVYGSVAGLPNVEATGFKSIPSRRWEGRFPGASVMIHGAEWHYCTRRHSDVVVLRWSPRSIVSILGLFRARMNGVGTVLWGHGYSKSERKLWVNVRNWLASKASAVVFYDPLTKNRFVEAGWKPERLFVAINSLDQTEIERASQWWRDRPNELQRFRKEHQLGTGPVILFVSRLQAANRVDLLVRATADLAKEFPELKTVIIGSGTAERERLQRLADELAVSDNLIFHDGIYVEQKLAPWFLSANIFCYPANVGLSLIHAFGYRLPAVTSDNLAAQNPEVVALEHGVNGLLYEDGSTASLAGALNELLMDDQLCATMAQAAYNTVHSRFTLPRMVDGLEAAIRYAAGQMETGCEEKALRSNELAVGAR